MSREQAIDELNRQQKNALRRLRRRAAKLGLRILPMYERNRRLPGWFLADVKPRGKRGFSLEVLEYELLKRELDQAWGMKAKPR